MLQDVEFGPTRSADRAKVRAITLLVVGAIISTVTVFIALAAGRGMLTAIGLLLVVIAWRLWVVASQQRDQTELLALIAEGQDQVTMLVAYVRSVPRASAVREIGRSWPRRRSG